MAVLVGCEIMPLSLFLIWNDSTRIFKVNCSVSLTSAIYRDQIPAVLLRSLITRHYGSRPTPETLPSHAFFSSLPISTLNFLDRSNFTAKTREEKISFMKGLTSVLDRFSEGLRTRKILPSLLEEVSRSTIALCYKHILKALLDERCSLTAIYSSKCLRNISITISISIC